MHKENLQLSKTIKVGGGGGDNSQNKKKKNKGK